MQLEKKQRETISLLAPLVGPIVKQLHEFTHSVYTAVKPVPLNCNTPYKLKSLPKDGARRPRKLR